MINNDKIFATEMNVYACSQGLFGPDEGVETVGDFQLGDCNNGHEDPDLDKAEESEEGIIEILHQHGKKISTNKELKDQVIDLKNKYNEKLVKNKSEFDKLGGFYGLPFKELMKSVGPSGAKFIELENVLLYKTMEHGSFKFSNVFCFIKTGEKYKKQDKNRKKPTMKTLNVACIVKK